MNTDLISNIDQTEFKEYTFQKDMLYIRPILILSILLYALFGLMDYYLYPQYFETFFVLRYLIAIPLIGIVFGLSYHPSFKQMYQYLLLFAFLVGGLCIIIMIHIIEGQIYYYGGLYLVFSVAFFLLRLKPNFTIIGVVILVLSFIILGLLFGKMDLIELFAESVFYIGFTILAVFGTKHIEQHRMDQYYKEMILQGENIVLEKQVYKQYEEIKNYHAATIMAIARLAESHDAFTGGHINRVGELSFRLSQKIPKDIYKENNIEKEQFLSVIKLASSLHDIGKIAISDTILNKPGKLTEDEFKIVKTHAEIGYNMLLSIQEDFEDNTFLSMGLDIAKSHHEWWNGSGYPEGLTKQHIPLPARIVALIDVYDALISKRSYKKPYTKSQSLSLIKEGIGTHFDPVLATLFIELVQESDDVELFGKS